MRIWRDDEDRGILESESLYPSNLVWKLRRGSSSAGMLAELESGATSQSALSAFDGVTDESCAQNGLPPRPLWPGAAEAELAGAGASLRAAVAAERAWADQTIAALVFPYSS